MRDEDKAKRQLIRELEEMRQQVEVLKRSETEREQLQIALMQAKQRWERTFDAVPDLIAILDTNFQIAHANKAMAGRLGLTQEECIGHTCYRIIHGTDLPPSFCPYRRLVEDGQEHTAEVNEEHLGGYFIVSASPLVDEDGQAIGCVHVARDITERKLAEEALKESENNYRSIFENTQDVFYRLDGEGNITHISPSCVRFSGYTPEELIGKSVLSFYYDPEDSKEFLETINEKGEVNDYETRLRSKDNTPIYISATAHVIFDSAGKQNGVEGTIRDVTQRKIAEEELKKHRDHLEQMVAARTAELQRNKEELEIKTKTLEEVNIALKVILHQIEKDKKDLEDRFAQNITQLILPYVEKIKKSRLDGQQYSYVSIIETNLKEVVKPFLHSIRQLNFTPRETQIATLIKDGKSTKEIADKIGVATSAIDTYRNKIRHKLGLNNKKINLQSYLQSL